MKLDTVLKASSLALQVAQDDNVRQLFTMVHQGAKRRGWIGPPPGSLQASKASSATAPHPVPFAPKAASSPASSSPTGPSLGKWLNAGNAKKALGMAGELAQLFLK
ncbi:MAG: hypothetical protein K6T78_01540 [Alicyclobacillus sp.]|nr:hypothetical protein [Alicyclobacillus sp.]